MKTKLAVSVVRSTLFSLLLLTLQPSTLFAQGTAFTYQGRLNNNGAPANGSYDLRFKLFLDQFGNTQAGSTQLSNAVPVANGLFMVTLDFGAGIFSGSNYWLEVDVKTNGGSAYANLSPLQAVTPAPYSIFAENAGALAGLLSANALQGTYGGALSLTNPANNFIGSFAGNGAGLTNLNAATLGGFSAGQFWSINGNSGTSPTNGNFLGTTDNQPLELKVSGVRVVHWERNSNAPIFGFVVPNIVSGYENNTIATNINGATIAGGGGPQWYGTTSNQTVNANYGTIGGGVGNVVLGVVSTIAGGERGFIGTNGYNVFLGGGALNSVEAPDSTLGGGRNNAIRPNASESFLGGGSGNSIQTNSSYSFLGGGTGNSIQTNSFYCFLGGGVNNSIQANGYESFLGGGYNNSIQPNVSQSSIGGGYNNSIQTNSGYCFLGGGANNTISPGSYGATVSGGYGNQDQNYYSVVGGGYFNTNTSYAATVSGGYENQATGSYSALGGGVFNNAGGFGATVSGGYLNQALGNESTVGGGYFNSVGGLYATIPGGYNNRANGSGSFAAGQQAQALHDGTFVWADSISASFSSTVSNQFNVRATGGVRFVTFGTGLTLDGVAQATSFQGNGSLLTGLSAGNISSGILLDARLSGNVALLNGNNAFTGAMTIVGDPQIGNGASPYHHLSLSGGNSTGFLYGSFLKYGDGIHLGYNYYADANGLPQIIAVGGGTSRISVGYGTIVLATGSTGVQPNFENVQISGTVTTVNGTFNNFCDRNAKQDFEPVNSSEILEKVAQLPVTEWSYKTEATTRHIGPMAQDFYAAFDIGTDDKHIAPIDEGGVALAAIKALYQKQEEDRAALKAKEEEIEKLNAQNQALGKRLSDLERLVADLARKAP